MKTLEEQFREYEVPEDIKESIIDEFALTFEIDELIKFIEKNKSKVVIELFKNKSVTEIKKITNALFGEDGSLPLLEDDERLLHEIIEHIDRNIEYLKRIRKITTSNNYDRLLVLVDFLVNHYISNFNYLDSRRKKVENEAIGITYIDGRNKDTRSEVDEFVSKILSSYEKQKVKKKD